MTDAVSRSDPEPDRLEGLPREALAAALRVLGAGIALVDGAGRLTVADPRFLDVLKRLDESGSSGDSASLPLACAGLIDTVRQGREARQTILLRDGGAVVLGAAAAGDGFAVVAVTPAARADHPADLPSGAAHQINNILGGMLANIYMALADLDPQNPVRPRLEAVNEAALAIRTQVRPVASIPGGRKPA